MNLQTVSQRQPVFKILLNRKIPNPFGMWYRLSEAYCTLAEQIQMNCRCLLNPWRDCNLKQLIMLFEKKYLKKGKNVNETPTNSLIFVWNRIKSQTTIVSSWSPCLSDWPILFKTNPNILRKAWWCKHSEMKSNRTAASARKYVAPMSKSKHFSAT